MRKIDAKALVYVVGDGKEKSHLFDIVGKDRISFGVRCRTPVVVSLVDVDGQTLFVDCGCVVDFEAQLSGFSGIEVVASESFAIVSFNSVEFAEKLDPTPLALSAVVEDADPMRAAVKNELKRYLSYLNTEKLLATDADFTEMMDDIESGDLEFDDDDPEFGTGHEEVELEEEEPLVAKRVLPAEPVEEEPAKPAIEPSVQAVAVKA